MTYRSKLSQAIFKQVGQITSSLQSKIAIRTIELTQGFSNRCPDTSQLKDIIGEIDNMRRASDKLAKKIKRFERFIPSISTSVRTARNLVKTLEIIPIPTSTPPGWGVPIGVTNKYSALLRNANKRLEELEDEQKAIIEIIDNALDSLSNTTGNFNNLLERVNLCIEKKLQEGKETQELQQLIRNIQTSEKNQKDSTIQQIKYRAQNGQDYILEVVTDPNSTNLVVPKRYAQAKNLNKVVVLKGPSSFSSSTEILIEELKFRINNQLP